MCSPYRGEASSRSTAFSYARGEVSFKNASSSAIVGGNPVRSNVTRRSNVALSAAGEGFNLSLSNRANTNASIGLRPHSPSFTFGNAERFGGTNAQCRSSSGHFAPAFSHCTSFARSASLRLRFESGGGICKSGSVLVNRLSISPSANTPDSSAPARSSSRNFAFRAFPSGPWQL